MVLVKPRSQYCLTLPWFVSESEKAISHPPNVRLPLLFAWPAVTFPAAEHHHPLADTHFTVPWRVEG